MKRVAEFDVNDEYGRYFNYSKLKSCQCLGFCASLIIVTAFIYFLRFVYIPVHLDTEIDRVTIRFPHTTSLACIDNVYLELIRIED